MSGFIEGFLGMLTAGGVLVLLLRFFGGELIKHQFSKALADHNHELAKQLAALQGGMSRLGDVLSRRNEREFSVTEGAWERMMVAVGTAQGSLSLNYGPKPPAFKMMQEAEALRVIDSSSFSEEQKGELRSPGLSERDELWRQFNFRQGVQASFEKWAEFKNWLSIRQIFLQGDVFAAFSEIRDELNKVITRARVYCMPGHTVPAIEVSEINRMLRNQVDNKINGLGEMIRTRFGFTEG